MSRVFRVKAEAEMIVTVSDDVALTVGDGLLIVPKSEACPHGARFDAQAVVAEGIMDADCGFGISVQAGDVTTGPIEELKS